jgi:hypothetical protein
MNKFDEFINQLKSKGYKPEILTDIIDCLIETKDVFNAYIILFNIQDNVLKLSEWKNKKGWCVIFDSPVEKTLAMIENHKDYNYVSEYLIKNKNERDALFFEIIREKYCDNERIIEINNTESAKALAPTLNKYNTDDFFNVLSRMADILTKEKISNMPYVKQLCLPTYQKYDQGTSNNQTANALVAFILNNNSKGFTGNTKQEIVNYGVENVTKDILKMVIREEHLKRKNNFKPEENYSVASLIYDNTDKLDLMLPLIKKEKCLKSLSREAVKHMVSNNCDLDLNNDIEFVEKMRDFDLFSFDSGGKQR